MKIEYTVIIEQDEAGFYVAEVPELYDCHTQAKSLDELMERVKEAIELCKEADAPPEAPDRGAKAMFCIITDSLLPFNQNKGVNHERNILCR